MRPPSRRRSRVVVRVAAALVAVSAAFGFGAVTLSSCGTDAVGIQACRDIEAARCNAAASCSADSGGLTAQQVVDCKIFYHDQCLSGLENTLENDGGGPSPVEIGECVAEIGRLHACIVGHVATMADCDVDLTVGIDPAVSKMDPCEVLMHEPEALAKCAFILLPTDAGVFDAADAGGDAFIL